MTAATSASFPQTTGTTGSQISGYFIYLTPPYAQAFAVLHIGGADEGTRVRFLGSQTNQIPPLTPASTGSYTIRVYDSLTGGTLLGETGTITVAAASAPFLNSGAAPSMVLDASASGALTSDAGLTTPQTTNGGAILGWKDSTSNHFDFNQTTAGLGGSLVTASQNGKSGVYFAATSSSLAYLASTTGILGVAYNGQKATGLTIATAFKWDALYNGRFPLIEFILSSNFYTNNIVMGNLGYYTMDVTVNTNSSQASIPGNDFAPSGQLIKAVITLDGIGAIQFFENTFSATGTYTPSTSASFDVAHIGSIQDSPSPDWTIYEVDVWPTVATGVGGATPTGDIATIMQYLTAKWAS